MLSILLNIVIYAVFAVVHPIHLSVTNADYYPKQKKFQITVKLFCDDFDRIIYKNYGVMLNTGKKNENKDFAKYSTLYIEKNLKIFVNNKDITTKHLKFKSKKINENSVWIKYTVKYKGDINTIKIYNSLMTDLYRDQKNLFILQLNNKQYAYSFNFNNKEYKILN